LTSRSTSASAELLVEPEPDEVEVVAGRTVRRVVGVAGRVAVRLVLRLVRGVRDAVFDVGRADVLLDAETSELGVASAAAVEVAAAPVTGRRVRPVGCPWAAWEMGSAPPRTPQPDRPGAVTTTRARTAGAQRLR
jgi:hypothetical protein